MRIAYFAHLNEGHGSGVVSKISAQVDHWRRDGHTVTLFIATADADGAWHALLGDVIVRRYGGPVSRVRAMTSLVRAVRSFRPQLIYLRWDLFYPPMLWFPPGVPLVAEVNTDDLAEYDIGPWIRARYNRMTRSLLLRRAAALVFVTSELSRLPSFRGYRARKVVITNGVDLAAYPRLPAVAEGPPRLAFVGTRGASWHGVDKLITLAGLRPDWRFEVVGLADPGGSAPNIRWHGPLERPDVLTVLARADVGVGTLALHRNAMEEACPLKVREYLAVGLPVFYGYVDPDADGLAQYVLRIANTETNVRDEITRIDAFVRGSRGVRVPRSIVTHLDIAQKEEQRLSLFTDLARS